MTAPQMDAGPTETLHAAGSNEVRLVGRLSEPAQEKELPSGDLIVTFRVVVPRPHRRGRTARGAAVDALECVAWLAKPRRAALRAGAGDTVEVVGALRRRFYGAGAVRVSRTDVEVSSVRVVRRATSG
ncbi:hypothetical protein GCM10023340_45760 [Nocardioides marinquilinus]|uniref:Single-stranded DNA-binding protein n=1 Tax=Nocardioides marinquilinus TaxID=1210400 RepID=A0ABP9Q502_9ACTN